jgi:hypothetical protein
VDDAEVSPDPVEVPDVEVVAVEFDEDVAVPVVVVVPAAEVCVTPVTSALVKAPARAATPTPAVTLNRLRRFALRVVVM